MRRKLIGTIGCASMIMTMLSCGGSVESTFTNDLIPVKNEKWQFINSEGQIVINPQFKSATGFSDGLARVEIEGEKDLIGYIDTEGQYVINATYVSGTIFREGFAVVVEENSEPKFINLEGEVIFTLKQAEEASTFSEGLARFSTLNEEGETVCGFVNTSGEVAINPQFRASESFSGGYAAVSNEKGEWGYIDKEGKMVINYQFNTAEPFKNGQAIVANESSYGTINTEGKFIVNPQFDLLQSTSDGLMVMRQGKNYGFVDEEGAIVINPQFSDASGFVNGLAAVESSGKWGFIDKEGKYVINPQFDFASSFKGKFAVVYSGNKIGLIDQEGKYLVNPQFDQVYRGFLSDDRIAKNELVVQTDFFDAPKVAAKVVEFLGGAELNKYSNASSASLIMEEFEIDFEDISTYTRKILVAEEEMITPDAAFTAEISFGEKVKSPITEEEYDSYWGSSYSKVVGYEPNESAMTTQSAVQIELRGKGYGKAEMLTDLIQNEISSDFQLDEERSEGNQRVFVSDEATVEIEYNKSKMVVFVYYKVSESTNEDDLVEVY